jgi:hypothetical protein
MEKNRLIEQEKLKDLVKKVWQKVKKGKEGEIEDPNQLKLDLPSDVSQKKIQPMIPGLTFKEKRKKYLSDFSKPPFFTNTRKWLDANFEGNIYVGPDLTKYGFMLSGYQKIKPWEKVKYPYLFVTELEDQMRSWNFAMAKKLGLTGED